MIWKVMDQNCMKLLVGVLEIQMRILYLFKFIHLWLLLMKYKWTRIETVPSLGNKYLLWKKKREAELMTIKIYEKWKGKSVNEYVSIFILFGRFFCSMTHRFVTNDISGKITSVISFHCSLGCKLDNDYLEYQLM